MTTRQQFLRAAALTATAPLLACGSRDTPDAYDQAAAATWRLAEASVGDAGAIRRELVRCATLAPSSHNTQCWKFRIEERAITLLPDLSRRCPAVDPDDHHLFVSLGCAAENLAQAARAHGLRAEQRSAGRDGVALTLDAAPAVATPLYLAIPQRQCTRGEYDGQPLRSDELRLLEQAGSGEGVRVILLTERAAMEQVLALVAAGNTAQLQDKAFVEELKAWIRFGRDEAARAGDGLFTGASGNPTAPRWLGSRLFDLFFKAGSENDKYSKQIRSSAGIAVFVSQSDDAAHWVEAGRCYERFALQATALGIRNAMINQPVEVASLRPQLASQLGITAGRPDLVVRFGRGPRMPASLRRPVQAVLV